MDERNFTYMFYGFAAAWVILALYVLTLVMRERSLRSQMDNLKRMVEPREKK
jgi:CcmD family protein